MPIRPTIKKTKSFNIFQTTKKEETSNFIVNNSKSNWFSLFLFSTSFTFLFGSYFAYNYFFEKYLLQRKTSKTDVKRSIEKKEIEEINKESSIFYEVYQNK